MLAPKAKIARASIRTPVAHVACASIRAAHRPIATPTAQMLIPFCSPGAAESTPTAHTSSPAPNHPTPPRAADAEEDRHAALYEAQRRLAGVAGLGIDSAPRGCAALDTAARRMTRPALRSVMVGDARFSDGRLEVGMIR